MKSSASELGLSHLALSLAIGPIHGLPNFPYTWGSTCAPSIRGAALFPITYNCMLHERKSLTLSFPIFRCKNNEKPLGLCSFTSVGRQFKVFATFLRSINSNTSALLNIRGSYVNQFVDKIDF